MLKFTVALIAATAAVAVSSSAFAAEQQAAKVVVKNGQTYYCVKQQVTGSVIPVRTCLTKSELEAQGGKVASASNNAKLASNASGLSNQN